MLTVTFLFLGFLLVIILPLATRGWESWRDRGTGDWPVVEGEFVSGTVLNAGGEVPFVPLLRYRFYVDGDEFEGSFKIESVTDREDAQLIVDHWLRRPQIAVAYQPGNPGISKPLLNEEKLLPLS